MNVSSGTGPPRVVPDKGRLNDSVCVSYNEKKSYRPNKYVGPPYSRANKINTARMSRGCSSFIDRYLLPAPDLSSKPDGRRCCCRSTGQTTRRTDTRPFYDAYRIVRGPRDNCNCTHGNIVLYTTITLIANRFLLNCLRRS